MGTSRENTLVVDFSVLPKRPEPFDAQKFMYDELKLDLSDTRNIQFHNVRNVVFVEMVDAATASHYHNSHHLRRVFTMDKVQYKIPVYVEDGAVNVRVHDLPPRMTNTPLKDNLQQYGTILSISREMCKNYFPGVYNGVRVVRMILDKPIPSYVTIDGETTLVTYRNQTKTCRICGQKSHPRQKCTPSGKRSTTTNDTHVSTPSPPFTETDFPALGNDQQKDQQQQQRETTPTPASDNPNQVEQNDDNYNSDNGSDPDELTDNNKRRLSTKRDENRLKRKNTKQGDQKCDRKDKEEESSDMESSITASPPVTRSKIKLRGNQKGNVD